MLSWLHVMQVEADADLAERACTPLRPAYAQDVRDAALVAANATDKLLTENVTFFGSATQVGHPTGLPGLPPPRLRLPLCCLCAAVHSQRHAVPAAGAPPHS